MNPTTMIAIIAICITIGINTGEYIAAYERLAMYEIDLMERSNEN